MKVLEIARKTWAVPLCGQMLAANGAEVVRVEFGPTSVPPVLHVGKKMLPFDPMQEAELKRVREDVLPGCNIFLTDLTTTELEDKQLDYGRVHAAHPDVLYVHTSSIGPRADISCPGAEDAGAFFCLTGLSEQFGGKLGPRGFAAATAASSLFAVTCLGVMRRRCGAPGERVEVSVFRAGRWCSTLGSLTGWALTPPRHTLPPPEWLQKAPAFPFEVEGAAHLVPPPHVQTDAKPRAWAGWMRSEPPVALPQGHPQSPVSAEQPLSRVSVIEISDEYLISAAAIGRLLADLGAKVTAIERPQRPNPWERNCPNLYDVLTRGKAVEKVNYSHVGGSAALYRALAETTIFLTNLPIRALEEWGLGVARLHQLYPHLIIVQVSTWGCDHAGRAQELECAKRGGGEMDAFWIASGLSSRCFGGARMPPGLSELAIAQHALAGICLALLRQQRNGTGQFVHVSRYQAGSFSRMISEVVPPERFSSPLLKTFDGRFLRLLGRGHDPHDVWAMLHAVGRRSPASAFGVGGGSDVRTWEEMEAHHNELMDDAKRWKFDDLVKALQEKGIDWFIEELRPTDQERVHAARAAEYEVLRREQEEAHREVEVQKNMVGRFRDALVSSFTGSQKIEHDKATAQLNEAERSHKQKSEERDMADYGKRWIYDRKGREEQYGWANAVVPESIDESAWIEACGVVDRDLSRPGVRVPLVLVAPGWFPASERRFDMRQLALAHKVTLFPDIAPIKPIIRVFILEAQDLQDHDWMAEMRPYVICEIPGKPHSKLQTDIGIASTYARNKFNWSHEALINDYVLGETIKFTVWDKAVMEKQQDDFLGECRLMPGEFFPNGFALPGREQGQLDPMKGFLSLTSGRSEKGRVKVQVKVDDTANAAGRPTLEVSIHAAKGLKKGGAASVGAYVICRVGQRQEIKIRTQMETWASMGDAPRAVEWNHNDKIKDYVEGDALEFCVFDKQKQNRDLCLGSKMLPAERFYPDGFNGQMELEGTLNGQVKMKVMIKVAETR